MSIDNGKKFHTVESERTRTSMRTAAGVLLSLAVAARGDAYYHLHVDSGARFQGTGAVDAPFSTLDALNLTSRNPFPFLYSPAQVDEVLILLFSLCAELRQLENWNA